MKSVGQDLILSIRNWLGCKKWLEEQLRIDGDASLSNDYCFISMLKNSMLTIH